MSLFDFIKEAGKKEDFLSRFPNLTAQINQFAQNDPSGKLKYLEWQIKILTSGQAPIQEIIDIANLFNKYGHKLDKKDINQYSPSEVSFLREKLSEYDGLKKEKELKEEQVACGSKIVYQSDKYIVRQIFNKDASCHYGRDTAWCIAATKSKNYFSEYDSNNVIFFFVFTKEEKPYNKIAIVYERDQNNNIKDTQYFDSADKSLEDLSYIEDDEITSFLSITKNIAQQFPKSITAKVRANEASEEDIKKFITEVYLKLEKDEKIDFIEGAKLAANKIFLDNLPEDEKKHIQKNINDKIVNILFQEGVVRAKNIKDVKSNLRPEYFTLYLQEQLKNVRNISQASDNDAMSSHNDLLGSEIADVRELLGPVRAAVDASFDDKAWGIYNIIFDHFCYIYLNFPNTIDDIGKQIKENLFDLLFDNYKKASVYDLPTANEFISSTQTVIPHEDKTFGNSTESYVFSTFPVDSNMASDNGVIAIKKFFKYNPYGAPYKGELDGKMDLQLLSIINQFEEKVQKETGKRFSIIKGSAINLSEFSEALDLLKSNKQAPAIVPNKPSTPERTGVTVIESPSSVKKEDKKISPEVKPEVIESDKVDGTIKEFQKILGVKQTGILDEDTIMSARIIEDQMVNLTGNSTAKNLLLSADNKKFNTTPRDLSSALNLIKINKKALQKEVLIDKYSSLTNEFINFVKIF